MAGLPPDGRYLIQQSDGVVAVLDSYSSEEFYHWNPADPNEFGPTMQRVWLDHLFTTEQKCFIAFWAGYFHAHAVRPL